MQVRATRDHRQSLVPGITAHRCTQRNGMPPALRQKAQIRTVGIIYQKRDAISPAYPSQRTNVLRPAQIIRAGDINAKGSAAMPLQCAKRICKPCCRDRAAAQRTRILRRRPEPCDIKIQQGGRINQCLMGVACCQQQRALCRTRCCLQRKAQHRPDALRGALGTIISVLCAEKPGRVGLALSNDPLRLVQLIRTFYLGDIPRFKAQQALPFVAGHVQPGGAGLRISAHKIHNGRGHAHSQASPSAQALQVEPSSMGTSMPFAASS